MTGTATARQALRDMMRARRRGLLGGARAAAELCAQRLLLEHPRVQAAASVALYRAFDGEVGTTALATELAQSGKRILYARARRDAPIRFVVAERWTTGRGGVPIPHGEAARLSGADVVVVPGVAFDDAGYRLGLGGGHYDRTLAICAAFPVGLAFEFQRLAEVPRAEWDRPVRALATEQRIYTYSSGEIED